MEFDEATLRSLLDRPIAFNRALVPVAGSITAALLLAQMLYWQARADDWFYKTGVEWLEETGLSREEFQGARRHLVGRGLIEYQVRGSPPVGHYRIAFEAVVSQLRETRKSICGKPVNRTAGNPSNELRETRNTPLTTETTHRVKRVAPKTRATPEGFKELWQAYPKRAGNNPLGAAERAFRARVKEGVDPSIMIVAAATYARFCESTGKAGSEYVMRASTFLGADRPYAQSWAPPASDGGNWTASPEAMLAKARELGISTMGESSEGLRRKIQEKLQGVPA